MQTRNDVACRTVSISRDQRRGMCLGGSNRKHSPGSSAKQASHVAVGLRHDRVFRRLRSRQEYNSVRREGRTGIWKVHTRHRHLQFTPEFGGIDGYVPSVIGNGIRDGKELVVVLTTVRGLVEFELKFGEVPRFQSLFTEQVDSIIDIQSNEDNPLGGPSYEDGVFLYGLFYQASVILF